MPRLDWKSMNWQRLMIGLIAVGCLGAGISLYFARPDETTGYVGILVRVGVLLGVICLAMPQLEPLKAKLSTIALLVTVLLLVVVAARPNWFRIVAGILAVTLIVNWALKLISRVASTPNEP